MSFFGNLGLERKLRTIHGWLGVLVLPWVLMAGLTGLYLNHHRAVDWIFAPGPEPTPAVYDGTDEARPVQSVEAAFAIAMGLVPGSDVKIDLDKAKSYHNRLVYTVDTGEGLVTIDRETGFVWNRQRYWKAFVAPDGTVLRRDMRWGRIFASIHERGWVGSGLGRWLADITAVTLVVFAISGMVMFFLPRLRRRRNRRARTRAAAGTTIAAARG